MKNFSPPIEISKVHLATRKASVHIIREDLLPGGTKQRAIIPFLEDLIQQGHDEFVYASPFCGFAQIALAYAGKHLQKKITIFCETMDSGDKVDSKFHEFSLLAQSLGASIKPCKDLQQAEQKASEYSRSHGAFQVPLGFNHEGFLNHYSKALLIQFLILKKKIDFTPKVLWVPIGSGTLVRLFRKVLPQEITLNCVDVRVLKPTDDRIKNIQNLENVNFYRADLNFHEESHELPPLPSNKYYDAKLWTFINRFATHNDIWWNVAR